jgi:hypothetical protein
VTRGEALRRTEQEIAAEKAAALGRAGERLEQALAEARQAAERLLDAGDQEESDRLAEAYTIVRKRALEVRTALLIQREALGLRRHTVVDQQFPEPPPAALVLKHRRLI